MNKLLSIVLLISAGCAITGCRSSRGADVAAEPTTRPTVTDVDPVRATPDYWLDQPAAASATGDDFDQLFRAAERAARNRYFKIDQADRRAGLMVTAPATSKQFFEVWRNDTGTVRGTVLSSLSTHRRTLQYQFTRNPDDTFTVTPKVLIERLSSEGRRVTIPAMALGAFYTPVDELDPAYRRYPWPADYWYPVGRDTALERKIARSIQSRLSR